MRIDVVERYDDKYAKVWFENECWLAQIINPKWFDKWLNVKKIWVKYKIDGRAYMLLELE